MSTTVVLTNNCNSTSKAWNIEDNIDSKDYEIASGARGITRSEHNSLLCICRVCIFTLNVINIHQQLLKINMSTALHR